MVDLEWNRKSIFEKLDWLKEVIDDLVSKANHNTDVQQKQILAITGRLSALEKPVRKSTLQKSHRATTAKTKTPIRVPTRGTNRSPQSKRKR